MFKYANGLIDICYSTHEFDVHGKRHITISKGDVFVLECDAERYEAKVLGYGYDSERNVLKMFVTFEDYDDMMAIEMLLFGGVLLEKGTQISVISDNERFFQIRVPNEKNTKEFATYIDSLQGITVKNWNDMDNPRYVVTQEDIGTPDWHIEFRATTNYGGAASFAKLSTLVSKFPGQVVIVAKNHRKPEEFVQSHASATVFFSICGIGITPKVCLKTLQDIDIKIIQ